MEKKGRRRGEQQILLPDEIINEEILTRLPIKHLVRIRSVCKTWESLIYDPKFIKAHLTRSLNQTPQEEDNLIVLTSCKELTILSRFKQTPLDVIRSFPYEYIVGSINGLVCIYNISSNTSSMFLLLNPAINQYKFLGLPQPLIDLRPKEDSYHYRRYTDLVGFGWDPVGQKFKVVACCLSARSRKAALYCPHSDSWTKLVIPDSIFPDYIFEPRKKTITPTAIVNNSPYWRYSNYVSQMRRKYTALVKFDVQTNEFISLPEFDYATVKGKDFDYVNIHDCFAVMVYKAGGSCKIGSAISSVDVYSLDEVSGVWSKMYTIGPVNFGMQSWRLLQGFKYGDEIAFVDGMGRYCCYDPKTNVISGFPGSAGDYASVCFHYISTLVFIPGMKNMRSLDLYDCVKGKNKESTNCRGLISFNT